MAAQDDVPEVAQALAEFIAAREPYLVNFDPPLDMRTIAAELRLLPVVLDMGGCLGIRPSGEAASFSWDDPGSIEIEPDERIRSIAYYRASLRYPAMAALAPRRPPDAVNCPHCDGTGRCIGISERLSNVVLCSCGGLGWSPRPKS